MNDNNGAYGIIGVVVVVALVGWALVSNSNQQKEANLEIVSSAVSDINNEINELHTLGSDVYGNIDDECTWQANELSGNIGDVCSNNTTGSHSLDGSSSYEISETTYTSMLEDGSTIEDVVTEMVSDANDNYAKIVDTMDALTTAFEEQCSWIEDNIDDGIAGECYEAGEGFDYEWRTPFRDYNYLEA